MLARVVKARFCIFGVLCALTVITMLLSDPLFQPNLAVRTHQRSKGLVQESTTYVEQQAVTCAHERMMLVSGYFNIGSFQKGRYTKHTGENYKQWAKPLGSIENPLAFYSDDSEMLKMIADLRAERNLTACTYVRLIRRSEMWAFSLVDNISRVINQPGYPKMHPNTVIPEYAAIMHAKMDILDMAMDTSPFRSDLVAWMDSGLFRDSDYEGPILLLPPPGFIKQMVAFNQVPFKVRDDPLKAIFHSDFKWYYGGGYFIASRSVMRRWCQQYREFTEYFLRLGLSNSDQQVIYGMFTSDFASIIDANKPLIQVSLQQYAPPVFMYSGAWYQLRNISTEEGARQKRMQAILTNCTSNSTRKPTPSSCSRWYFDAVAGESKKSQAEIHPLIKNRNMTLCSHDVTFVTAYFDLKTIVVRADKFRSTPNMPNAYDEVWQVRDSSHYSTWLASLAKVRHAVVAYFDNDEIETNFRKDRKNAGLDSCTYTQLIDRDTLWSWKATAWIHSLLLQHDAKPVYNVSGPYATYDGRTAEYVSALHSKYALLEKATDANPFNTTHFVWMDATIFQELDTTTKLECSLPVNQLDVLFFEEVEHQTTPAWSANTPSSFPVSATSALEAFSKSSLHTTSSGRSAKGNDTCQPVMSTGYLTGTRQALNIMSRAYKLTAEATLARKLVLNDKEVLQALYSDSNLRTLLNGMLGSALPTLKIKTTECSVLCDFLFASPISSTSLSVRLLTCFRLLFASQLLTLLFYFR